MKKKMTDMQLPQQQTGAALVVGLILLVVVTVLAVSGMNTATTELAMARNDQNYENAFQAAENGLEIAIARNGFNTTVPVAFETDVNANDSVSTSIQYSESTIVPDKAFSLGVGTGISAYHFVITATAESARDTGGSTGRDASAIHTQAFYVVGPEAPTL